MQDAPNVDTYVVCLDCGKQFEYDLKEMRLGKAIDPSHRASVVPSNAAANPKAKMKYAVAAAAAPVAAVVIGSIFTARESRKNARTPEDQQAQ